LQRIGRISTRSKEVNTDVSGFLEQHDLIGKRIDDAALAVWEVEAPPLCRGAGSCPPHQLLVRHAHLVSIYYSFFYLARFWIKTRHGF
jgi:hypothetical protein